MTNDERFELIWNHYHKQIDENRAVNRSLDEIRKHSLSVQRLVIKVNKMSFMMGFIFSNLYALSENYGINMAGEKHLRELIEKLSRFVEDEIYNDEQV